MIKAAITILLLGFALVFGSYYIGGVDDYDPTARGREAKAALSEGMSWQEVLDAAGNPMRMQAVYIEKRKIGDEMVDMEQLGPRIDFASDLTPNEIEQGAYKDGFIFEYTFSHQAAFKVVFDASGKAVDIADIMTMADLLDSRE